MNQPETPAFPPNEPPPEALVRRLYEQQQTLRDEVLRLREEQLRLREKVGSGDARKKDDGDAGKDGKSKDDGGEKKADGGDKPGDKHDPKQDVPKKPLPAKIRDGARAHPLRTVLILLVIAGVVTAGLWLFHHIHTYEGTDDAQVDADVSAISPRITGTVTGVYVVDNQIVHAGDLLVEMDVPDYQVAIAQAQANLEQAKAQAKGEAPNVPITDVNNTQNIATSGSDVSGAGSEAAAAERDYIAAMAQERAAEADYQNALLEQQRSQKLVQTGAVSPQDYDTHTTTAAKSLASLDAARAATQASLNRQAEARSKLSDAVSKSQATKANAPRQVEIQKASVASREAQVLAAQAQLDQAELNLKYTKIYAPVDGIIGKKSVNIGDRVSPGQQLFALVQTKDLWVTANYRETQLQHMHPGERAVIHVDALDLDFEGSVQSMPGATGAIYSLLPPENATGNYVKVVQRLPVRIQINANQVGYDRLRPGMSVEPTVYLQ